MRPCLPYQGLANAPVLTCSEQHRCSLRVLNDGHHWLFRKPGFVAEWWPSSARLAVDRDYDRHIHAPHWAEVVTVLQQHVLQQHVLQQHVLQQHLAREAL